MPWVAVPPISIPTDASVGSAGGLRSIGHGGGGDDALPRLVGVQAADAKFPPLASEQPFSDDVGKVVFYNSDTSKWIMAAGASVKFGMVADGGFLAIQPTEINGYAWFSDGTNHVYKSVGFGWVYTSTLDAGVEPREWRDDDLAAYQGDEFWAGTTILTSLSPRGIYLDDGSTAAITTAIYTPDYERWESDTRYGAYTAAGGATGTWAVGNATWTDGSGGTWTQRSDHSNGTKAKDLHRPFSYFGGSSELFLQWNATASAYVAGTYGSELGWWQNASAPVAGSAYTITFAVPEESEVTGSDIELTPSSYVDGDWIPTKVAIYALDWAVMV